MGISMEITTNSVRQSREESKKRAKQKGKKSQRNTQNCEPKKKRLLFKQWNIQKWYLFGKQANTNIKNIITFHLSLLFAFSIYISLAFSSAFSFRLFECVRIFFLCLHFVRVEMLLWQASFFLIVVICCAFIVLVIFFPAVRLLKFLIVFHFRYCFRRVFRFCLRMNNVPTISFFIVFFFFTEKSKRK